MDTIILALNIFVLTVLIAILIGQIASDTNRPSIFDDSFLTFVWSTLLVLAIAAWVLLAWTLYVSLHQAIPLLFGLALPLKRVRYLSALDTAIASQIKAEMESMDKEYHYHPPFVWVLFDYRGEYVNWWYTRKYAQNSTPDGGHYRKYYL